MANCDSCLYEFSSAVVLENVTARIFIKCFCNFDEIVVAFHYQVLTAT